MPLRMQRMTFSILPYEISRAHHNCGLTRSESNFLADKSFLFVKPGRSIDWHGDLSSLKGFKIFMVEGCSLGRGLDN
jgi:hypothetical protein